VVACLDQVFVLSSYLGRVTQCQSKRDSLRLAPQHLWAIVWEAVVPWRTFDKGAVGPLPTHLCTQEVGDHVLCVKAHGRASLCRCLMLL
jgi:hypothetical protein